MALPKAVGIALGYPVGSGQVVAAIIVDPPIIPPVTGGQFDFSDPLQSGEAALLFGDETA